MSASTKSISKFLDLSTIDVVFVVIRCTKHEKNLHDMGLICLNVSIEQRLIIDYLTPFMLS